MGVPTSQAKRENITAANLLLSLSISNKINMKSNNRRKKKNNGVFECKTCSREFASFQALGGHCTSHLRPKVRRINGIDVKIGEKSMEPTKHTCSYCGKEFPMGQALGGHMRLHRVSPVTSAQLGRQIRKEEEIDFSILPTTKDEKLGFHIDEDVISESFEGRLLNLFV